MAAAGEVMPHSAAKEVVGVGGCNGSSSSSASSLGSGADQELHVLAVDDSYVDLKVIERLLRISSCKVTAVESAKRALQYLGLDGETNSVGFSDLKVNLIMTDYSMPGMTGYELLKKIKGSTAFRETPVVIMSSENVLTRVDRCLEEGAEEFIMKPVKLSDVKRLKEFIIRAGTEERGITTLGKRKLQDGILSSSLVELSPTESPACEVASSALPSSTPTSYISTSMTPASTVSTTWRSAMSSSKRTTLQSGE